MSYFVKKPCTHCPFRNDVKPFLHPERAYEIALVSQNKYSEFHCHKTLERDDEEGGTYAGPKSLMCAGMLTMRANAMGEDDLPKGFKPSFEIVYEDAFDMYQAYQEEWDRKNI
jgi:hypothetical protein